MSKFKDIKSVMEHHFRKTKIDGALANQIKMFRLSWVQKDPMYSEFIGGNLIGVQPIRFSTLDEQLLLNDILNIDIRDLGNDLLNLKELGDDWNVAGNPVYQCLIYLMRCYIVTDVISKKATEEVLYELYFIFAYRVMSSLTYNGFKKYNAPISVAKATYENLSNRFILKKAGSWQKLFEIRAGDVLPPKGVQYKRLVRYTTLDAIRVAGDLQGYLRGYFVNIYDVMANVTANSKVQSTSLHVESDVGGSMVAVTDRPDALALYVKGIIGVPTDFINDDIIHLVTTTLPNLEHNVFKEVITNISNNFDDTKYNKSKSDFIAIAIVNTIAYINTKGITGDYKANIMTILKYMKGYWTSSSVKDKDVKLVKVQLLKIVTKNSSRKTKWLVTSMSIGVLLYIFTRAVMGRN